MVTYLIFHAGISRCSKGWSKGSGKKEGNGHEQTHDERAELYSGQTKCSKISLELDTIEKSRTKNMNLYLGK